MKTPVVEEETKPPAGVSSTDSPRTDRGPFIGSARPTRLTIAMRWDVKHFHSGNGLNGSHSRCQQSDQAVSWSCVRW